MSKHQVVRLQIRPDEFDAMEVRVDNIGEVVAWLLSLGFDAWESEQPGRALCFRHRGAANCVSVGYWLIYDDVDKEIRTCADEDLDLAYETAGREWWQVQEHHATETPPCVMGTFSTQQAAFDAIPDYAAAFPTSGPMSVQRVVETGGVNDG